MRKNSLKHFKAVVSCLVAAVVLTTLLFITVQPTQAARTDLSEPSDAVSQAAAETETIDENTSNTDKRRILDGASDVDNVGDTLTIEEGGELRKDGTFTGNTEDTPTAVFMTGKHNTVNNSGWISTEGNNVYAISLDESSYANITNSSWISTEGNWAHAIFLYGSNDANIINNNKNSTISTLGDYSHGIFSSYSDNTTINNNKNSTISTLGTNSHGIRAWLAADDTSADGTYKPDNINIINKGTIAVEGSGSVGIKVREWSIGGTEPGNGTPVTDLTTTIDNDGGTISAAAGGHAIKVETIDNFNHLSMGTGGVTNLYLRNGSTIKGHIDLGTGIDNVTIGNSDGSNTGKTETVNGNIDLGSGENTFKMYENSTLSAGVDGVLNIYSGNDIDTFTFYGGSKLTATTIDTGGGADLMTLYSGSEVTADSIDFGGGNDTLTLRPDSKITGNVYFGAGDDTMTLYSDSMVNGDINLGEGADTMTVYEGAVITGAIDFGADTDVDTLNIPGGNFTLTTKNYDESVDKTVTDPSLLAILNGNTIMTVDKTGQVAKAAVLSGFTTGLHGIVNNRMTHFKPAQIKLAATRITPGMLKTPKQPQAWGHPFHSYRKRDEDGRVPGYDHKYNGFTGGFERSFNRVRLGVLAGYSHAVTEADNKSFQTKSNSYFTGAYGQYDFGRIKLAAALIGGYEDHDNDRYLTDNLFGSETARADFGSIFLSPSVTLSADFTVAHRLLLRPSATVVYSAGWYDDYNEHGTTRTNVEVDSRTIQTLNPQLQLAAVYQIAEWCEFELSAGGKARYTDDGTFSGNLGSSDFRVAASGDDNVYGAQVGAYLSADVTDRLELYANAQFTDASGGETRDFFMAGLKFEF